MSKITLEQISMA